MIVKEKTIIGLSGFFQLDQRKLKSLGIPVIFIILSMKSQT